MNLFCNPLYLWSTGTIHITQWRMVVFGFWPHYMFVHISIWEISGYILRGGVSWIGMAHIVRTSWALVLSVSGAAGPLVCLKGPWLASNALCRLWAAFEYIFRKKSYFHSSSTFSFCLLLFCLISFSDVAFVPWENQTSSHNWKTSKPGWEVEYHGLWFCLVKRFFLWIETFEKSSWPNLRMTVKYTDNHSHFKIIGFFLWIK